MAPSGIFLQLDVMHPPLWAHLLRADSLTEQAAFVFARIVRNERSTVFEAIEWQGVSPDGFEHQSKLAFELTQNVKAHVIKRAHDLEASVVEFHSHRSPWAPSFSPSDHAGMNEFVPHVWWRLGGRPYMAVLVSPAGFEGLAWIDDPTITRPLNGIIVGDHILRPTRVTSVIGSPER